MICQALFLFLAGSAYAQPGIEWGRLSQKPANDRYSSLIRTSDGGYAICGEVFAAGSGSTDFLVSKLSSSGGIEWERTFGGPGTDKASRIIQTSDGGYLVGGTSSSARGGDKSAGSTSEDFWLIKINANGTKVWDKTVGGNASEVLKVLKTMPDGNFIAGGWSESGVSGSRTVPTRGGMDYWIVKISQTGDIIWDKAYGGTTLDALSDLDFTADGGIVLAGYSMSGKGGDKTDPTKVGYEGYDIWLVKLSATGTKLWDKTIGGYDTDFARTVAVLSDGGILIGGSSASMKSGDKSESARGPQDYWIIKTDASGNMLWEDTIGGPGADNLTTFLRTKDGGFVFSGASTSGVGGDKRAALRGTSDGWLVKLDESGKKVWDKTLGGPGNAAFTQPFALVETDDGGLLVAGYASGTGTGDLMETSQSEDGWLLKLAPVNATKKLRFSTGSIELTATSGGNNVSQTVTLSSSTGRPPLSLGQAPNTSWLSTSPAAFGNFTLTCNPAGLARGRYTSTVVVTSPDYVRANVDVVLHVRTPPVITVNTAFNAKINKALSFTAKASVNDGEYAVFSLVGAPNGALMDSLGNFLWTPSAAGTFKFKVKATSNIAPVLSSQVDVTITVTGNAQPGDVVRINSGGGDYITADGRFFEADKYYSGTGGTSYREVGDIANTVDDEFYNHSRCSPQFQYAIPVRRGLFRVILHFAEVYWGVPPQKGGTGRRMNISAEGKLVYPSFDINAQAGGPLRAYQLTLEVPVLDGVLDLGFVATADIARLSGIEVLFFKELQTVTLAPVADAFVQQGASANINFGTEPTLEAKAGTRRDLLRESYLKFSLAGITNISAAKIRIYAYNHEGNDQVPVAVDGLNNNNWTETGITANNAPKGSLEVCGQFAVSQTGRYYELDITRYANLMLRGERLMTFLVRDIDSRKMRIIMNSKEAGVNPPEVIIETANPVATIARISASKLPEAVESEPAASVVFPNPVQKEINVQISNRHHDNISLQLISAAGHVFPLRTKEQLHRGTTAAADISNLSLGKGIYLLRVQSNDASEILKVHIAE